MVTGAGTEAVATAASRMILMLTPNRFSLNVIILLAMVISLLNSVFKMKFFSGKSYSSSSSLKSCLRPFYCFLAMTEKAW